MDQATIQAITDEAANKAVAQMREFHLDDLKAQREYTDIKFESPERKMDEGFVAVDSRFDEMDSRMGNLEGRMGVFEARMTRVEDRLDRVDDRLDRIESALETLIRELREDRAKIAALEKQIVELTARVQFLESKLQNA